MMHRIISVRLAVAALSLGALGFQACAQTRSPADALQQRIFQAQRDVVEDCTVPTLAYKASGKTPIYPRAGKTVTIGFQSDESIVTVIWDEPKKGDLVEDYVQPDGRTLTMRVRNSSLSTVPGVVTTTQRRYFLVVTPTEPGPGVPCYQGVIFSGSEGSGGGFNPFGTTFAPTGNAAASVSEVAPVPRPGDDVFSGTPNFGYTIKGEANFKPVAVYDNGRFTWIRFGTAVQALPAVFYSGPNGLEIVNATAIDGGTGYVVNRLMEKIVLRIDASEVTVTANQKR